MTSPVGADVVVVGGGIAGVSTAYFLGEAGFKCVVVERDSVGSHASGFAYGGLSSLVGPGPTLPVAAEGMRLHRQLSQSLPEETGTNIEFRDRPSLSLAFSEEETEAAKDGLAWKQVQEGYAVRWLGPEEVGSVEPQASSNTFGGVYVEGTAHVEPYRLMLALTQASEKRRATIVTGRVTGLMRQGDRVTGVTLEDGEIAAPHVVLAMGPWAEAASPWLGLPIPIRPLKGQILRLRASGPPIRCSLSWGGYYATTKPDGLVWAGTTEEEEVGFDERTTSEAREQITRSLLRMAPSLTDAELVRQTACLRPITPDRLLLLGKVPNREGVYLATGAGRQGVLLGPAMGRITADLITSGGSTIPIDAFDPGRFS